MLTHLFIQNLELLFPEGVADYLPFLVILRPLLTPGYFAYLRGRPPRIPWVSFVPANRGSFRTGTNE